MKKAIFIGLILAGCSGQPKSDSQDTQTSDADTVSIKTTDNLPFDFSRFKITKGQLGEIKIGMTLKEVEKKLTGLTKKEVPVYEFGLDGERPVPSYYLKDTLVLALITKYDSDTLRFIIAAHKNFRTANGLSAKSSVKDLVDKYPDLEVNMNMMNGWEYISDEENNCDFTFVSSKKGEIGEYQIAGEPSKPKRLTRVSDWITIGI